MWVGPIWTDLEDLPYETRKSKGWTGAVGKFAPKALLNPELMDDPELKTIMARYEFANRGIRSPEAARRMLSLDDLSIRSAA